MCVCLSVSLCVRLRVHGSVGVGDVLVQWSRNVSLPTVVYVHMYICVYVCTVGVVLCCVVLCCVVLCCVVLCCVVLCCVD